MLDMITEDHSLPIVEIFTTKLGRRNRVFRGRNKNQIEWKMTYHEKEGHRPELVEVEPGEIPAG